MNSDSAQGFTSCDDTGTIPTVLHTITSPLGQEVNIFNECLNGTCSCVYIIGDIVSQLKPCRFTSIILLECERWADQYLELLWLITDGCPIVDSEVEPYDCKNYASITCSEVRSSMDSILQKELSEDMVSLVSIKPTCIHAL